MAINQSDHSVHFFSFPLSYRLQQMQHTSFILLVPEISNSPRTTFFTLTCNSCRSQRSPLSLTLLTVTSHIRPFNLNNEPIQWRKAGQRMSWALHHSTKSSSTFPQVQNEPRWIEFSTFPKHDPLYSNDLSHGELALPIPPPYPPHPQKPAYSPFASRSPPARPCTN